MKGLAQPEILYLPKPSPNRRLEEDLFRPAKIILINLPCTFLRKLLEGIPQQSEGGNQERERHGTQDPGSNGAERRRRDPDHRELYCGPREESAWVATGGAPGKEVGG